jgi:hypothetical protein
MIKVGCCNIKTFVTAFVNGFNMITIKTNILKKLIKFLLDLEEYKASSVQNFVLFGNMIFALLEPSIRFDEPDIVLTLALFNIKYLKYFLSLRIMCIVQFC